MNGKQIFEQRNLSDRIREFELPRKIYRILVGQTAIAWHCRGFQTVGAGFIGSIIWERIRLR